MRLPPTLTGTSSREGVGEAGEWVLYFALTAVPDALTPSWEGVGKAGEWVE
jgi:hypothetical protein